MEALLHLGQSKRVPFFGICGLGGDANGSRDSLPANSLTVVCVISCVHFGQMTTQRGTNLFTPFLRARTGLLLRLLRQLRSVRCSTIR